MPSPRKVTRNMYVTVVEALCSDREGNPILVRDFIGGRASDKRIRDLMSKRAADSGFKLAKIAGTRVERRYFEMGEEDFIHSPLVRMEVVGDGGED